MNYAHYQQLFDDILNSSNPQPPYDKESYLQYTKLNQSRMKRWDKHGELSAEVIAALQNISAPQHWIIITEPWCGDAAHCVPFLIRMTEQNPLITYELQLRDSAPFLIESYLTNGSKSIPKLIARDANGNDLFIWGPRPAGAEAVRLQLKDEDFETLKIGLQNWYNADKGKEICAEIEEKLTR